MEINPVFQRTADDEKARDGTKVYQEIFNIIDRNVKCCTVSQLTEYINKLHSLNPNDNGYVYSDYKIISVLRKMDGMVHVAEGYHQNKKIGDILVYSRRFANTRAITQKTRDTGIAKMATIICFMPYSNYIYDVQSPMSFTFFRKDTQVEVSVIHHGFETQACRVLSQNCGHVKIDKDKVYRIAFVENEEAAQYICHGGFESVCVIDSDYTIKQVRSIPKEEAWFGMYDSTGV